VIDRTSDLHSHSDITDGSATPAQMADAAVSAGLQTWGLSDHVRADTPWLGSYVDVVRALRRDGLTILCGVEAKMLDTSGRLDLPARIPVLDYVLVADHQFPGADGPIHPDEMHRSISSGAFDPGRAVEQLVRATCAALKAAPIPPVVAHLFSVLPKCGLSEDLVSDELLDELAATCVSMAARVEVNEKWRCPSEPVLAGLRLRGVALCAGSDAHRAEDVGSCSYLDELGALR
jgi:putative hydrolase